MDEFDFPKLRRDVFKVTSLFDQSDDKEYWLSKTPQERLEAVDLMRRMIYGYDPSTAGLQRDVFEVIQRQ
jgi:septum formation topological specificity factor MinE